MSLILVILIILTSFVAGATQACLGFGLGLILTPVAMMFFPPIFVVPAVLLLSLMNSSMVTVHARRNIRTRLAVPLAMGGIVGFYAGMRVLLMVNPDLLKCGVGAMVLLFSIALLKGWNYPLRDRLSTLFFVGVAGGFCGGSTSIAGPPPALFFANQNTASGIFRANLIAYYFTINCFGLILFLKNGLFSREVLLHTALLVPSTFAGTLLGTWTSRHLRPEAFRLIVLLMATLAGSILLLDSLHSLSHLYTAAHHSIFLRLPKNA